MLFKHSSSKIYVCIVYILQSNPGILVSQINVKGSLAEDKMIQFLRIVIFLKLSFVPVDKQQNLFLCFPLQWRTALRGPASTRTRSTLLVAHQVRASPTITPPPTLLLYRLSPLTLPWVSLTPPTAQTWVSGRRACLLAPSRDWMSSTVHPGRTTARSRLP